MSSKETAVLNTDIAFSLTDAESLLARQGRYYLIIPKI